MIPINAIPDADTGLLGSFESFAFWALCFPRVQGIGDLFFLEASSGEEEPESITIFIFGSSCKIYDHRYQIV